MADGDTRATILVVDDEASLLEGWRRVLGRKHEVVLQADPLAALDYVHQSPIDVALLDVKMPGMDGLQLLRQLRQSQPQAEAIMVSGHGTIEIAVQAMKLGAYDFLTKPVDDLDAAMRRIDSAIERRRLRQMNASLKSRLEAYGPQTRLIGESPAIKKIRQMIERIAASRAPVLICGESGTGKEIVARSIAATSDRSTKPFVAINCAAISESLIDSELFGHERGAFTGAQTAHKGVFVAADKGILFLDEIGDMPLQTQVRLLRVLQEGDVRPVGSTKSQAIDVRVLLATNVDVNAAVRDGRFREDLFYRINTFRIDLPPLRERRSDIPLIAQYLLQRMARRQDRDITGFTDAALAQLMAYAWPGNVRELYNVVEYAVTMTATPNIGLDALPAQVTAQPAPHTPVTDAAAMSGPLPPFYEARDRQLHQFEERYLTDLLRFTGGNLSEASRVCGVDRSALRRLLKRHSISAAPFKPRA